MAKSKDISPARLAAFRILKQVDNGAFSSVLLAAEEPQLKPVDRALCHELVLGVLRWQLRLDKLVQHYAQRSVESLDPAVRLALRLGLYQLRYLARIPASAAVNESVSLVRAARLSSATAFVNAVLRRAIREAEYDPVTGVTDPIERLAVETSHPVWLIDRWARAFGITDTELFARANNVLPPTAFRTVLTRASEDDVLHKLRQAGAELEPSRVADGAWRISGAVPMVRELSESGQIYVQDEASQLVGRLVGAQACDLVLDVCAAPGGKTTYMSDRANDQAALIAGDRSAGRLATIVETASRQGLQSIQPLLLDAEVGLPFRPRTFNKVLVDAPCSGTGTLRRNPEIRWRLMDSEISAFVDRQKQILRNASEMVKPGGRLVYSTCSVEREENEEVVAEFLANDAAFQQRDSRRTWPQREGCDGFFVAVFERVS